MTTSKRHIGAMPRSKSCLIVAAFDFGTTYSGYAYSYKSDTSKVITTNWYSAGASSPQVSLKTPTCVLLDDKGDFHSFGYEAEDVFAALAEDNKHLGWRLFRRFKMLLHNNKNISRQTEIEDIAGKTYPAIDIFAMAIKYLHRHLLENLQLKTVNLLESNIQYVITVPAIWDDASKQFMREAAIKAGIDGDRLEMAYESEVAAIWCTQRATSDDSVTDLSSAGKKYMVIDLGGGTADITVHERLPNGRVKEIHKASGGAWGGIYVDQHFLEHLEKVFGSEVLEELRKNHLADYFELIRDFETKKRSDTIHTRNICRVRIPGSLMEIVRNRNKSYLSSLKTYLFGGRALPVNTDKLQIDSSDVKKWFDEPINRLIEHVKDLFTHEKVTDVQTLLLVGGFAESKYVQDKLRKELVGMNLIVPVDSGLAVLKGAVMFGHNPHVVTSRIMKYTYGIQQVEHFDASKHSESHKRYSEGTWWAEHIFCVFVKRNEEINIDHEVIELKEPLSCKSFLPIYRTLSVNPKYTTDPGCELLGTVNIQNADNVPLQDQTIRVTFMFGRTELCIKVKNITTGKEEFLTLDCLK